MKYLLSSLLLVFLHLAVFAGGIPGEPPVKHDPSKTTVIIPSFQQIEGEFTAVSNLTDYLKTDGQSGIQDLEANHADLLSGYALETDMAAGATAPAGVLGQMSAGLGCVLLLLILLGLLVVIGVIIWAIREGCSGSNSCY